MKIRRFFWGNRAIEAVEASEVAEADEVNEVADVSKGSKITLFRVIQVLEFNSFWWGFFDVLKKKVFLVELWNIRLNFSTFFAVEANLCFFFENWLMKLKCQDLLKPLGTLIHQNPQFYYPLEPFSFNKFNMRHPVCADNLGHKKWQCAFVRYPR